MSVFAEARQALRPIEAQTDVPHATANVPAGMPAPAASSLLGTTLNPSVASMHSTATPSYNSLGQALAPGRGHGVGITTARQAPLTATGEIKDPFKRYQDDHHHQPQQQKQGGGGGHRTLSELKASRRMAMRADASYDLDGDGTVSQKDFFFATRFDTDQDGNLTHAEKLAARKIMRQEENKFVFVKTSGSAADASHRIMQKEGQVISEQLDGWSALTRAKVHGAQEAAGQMLPFDIQGAAAGTLSLTGSAGIVKENIDIDIDDSDNVALMHTAGQVIDYDNVVTKPMYRPELNKAGAKSLSALKFHRKMKQRAPMSYDLDGDGMVSQKDYFFAVRFDKDGNGNLEPEEKAAAAEAMRTGFGNKLAFLRGSGPADAHHRVFQKDGAIMSEETEGGWNSLTRARQQGAVVRIGGDGNLIDDNAGDGNNNNSNNNNDGNSPPKAVHAVVLSDEGKVALQHVQGALVDYDTVTIKPQFRTELTKSGVHSKSELLFKRRKERYPDLSMDLDGDGAVSQADYWFSKRYDVDDNNRLSPPEKEKAKRDYDLGFQKRFVTLNSSSGPGMAVRVHQMQDGTVLSEGEGLLAGSIKMYDEKMRLPTLGIAPGLDLPPNRMMLPHSGSTQTGSLAGTYKASTSSRSPPREALTRPRADASIGVVPGVARVILRNPDGTQEAYGGYGGGMGAGPLNNVTGTLAAVMGRPVGPGHAAVTLSPNTKARMSTGFDGMPEFRVKPDNIGTFSDRGLPHEIYKQAPFALMGVGGAKEIAETDIEIASNKGISADYGLLTRTQLIAARRLGARSAEGRDFDAAAGALTGSILGDMNSELSKAQEGGENHHHGESIGEHALRATLRSTTNEANLPAYMLQSLANRNVLPVLRDDLPHETVKPGALPETVRTNEAVTRSALEAGRVRDAKLAALELTRQPETAVAMPELYPPGFNDHHSHGHVVISEGQESLSKTLSQLDKRRLAERVAASMEFAPAEPYGVHKQKLPSFAKKLDGTGMPWYSDKSHQEGVVTNFMGSALDGQAGLDAVKGVEDAEYRNMPNYIDPIPPEYDPTLRHTVRDVQTHGSTFTSTSTMGATSSGIGSKTVRLIRDGMTREDEEVSAALGDPFKMRTIHPRKLDRYLRKHGLKLPEKPTRIDPWMVAKQELAATEPGTFRPTFDMAKPGGRPVHAIHMNLSNWGNGLPGPKVDKQKVQDNTHKGRLWSTAVIEYRQSLDTHDEKLDESGKELLVDPKNYAPLYSSFTKDHTFRSDFMKGNMTNQPRQDLSDAPPVRRNSVYGGIIALPSVGDSSFAGGRSGGGGGGGILAVSTNINNAGFSNSVTTSGGGGAREPLPGYESTMTPGGSWHPSTEGGLYGSRHASGGDGGGSSNQQQQRGQWTTSISGAPVSGSMPVYAPARAAERASPTKPLVDTLIAASGGRGSGSGGNNNNNKVQLAAAPMGVRTGGFGNMRR